MLVRALRMSGRGSCVSVRGRLFSSFCMTSRCPIDISSHLLRSRAGMGELVGFSSCSPLRMFEFFCFWEG